MVYYEEWFQKLESLNRNLVKCPVCSSKLGYRTGSNAFVEHCDECKATYVFNIGCDKPSVRMDSCLKCKKCDCGRCD